MRVTSALWVSALIRRAQAGGAFATVLRKGAHEAGAIHVVVNNLNGAASLYGPALQLDYTLEDAERRFECVLESVSEQEISKKLDREEKFDPDIWVVEIEDRGMRSFIENGMDGSDAKPQADA